MQAIKVLVVDDHPVVREGLVAMLGRLPGLVVVGEASDGQQALEKVHRLKPDVVLMDLNLPVMDGVEATARIGKESPETRVLVLTTFDQDELILSGLRAGARGYLLKDAPREDIFRSIQAVQRGEVSLGPTVAARVVEMATRGLALPGQEKPTREVAEGPLSEREKDVLRCLAEGLSNKEISVHLGIAESTVKTHLASLFAKLQVNDRTQAVTSAIRRGWLRLR